MPFVKTYTVNCPCGGSFVTISPRIRWCLPCRKSGRNKGRRNSFIAKMRGRSERIKKYSTQGSHSEEQWMQVLRNQAWCCYYCEREMTELTWTRDHVVPLSNGGSDDISNIVAACRTCNIRKGTMTASAFKQYLFNHIQIQQQKQEANFPVDKVIETLQEANDGDVNRVIDERWKTTSESVEPRWMDEEYRRQSGG